MEYIKKYWIFIVVVFAISMLVKPALCFLIIGFIGSYSAIDSIRFQKRLGSNGIECTGRILSFEVDSDGDKTPVIEFTPIGGAVITEKPFVYATTDLNKISSYDSLIGNEVLITYDPDDPKRFILSEEKGFNSLIIAVLLLAGLGSIAFGIASLTGYVKLR